MSDLYGHGLRGRLPQFIQHFLSNRSFRIRLSNNVSSSFCQEEGVPQGSILSVTLFAIENNACHRTQSDSSLLIFFY